MSYHLAQANIAKFKASLDSPVMKEFTDFITPINKLAEESPGFIWRLKDNEGRSSSYIETPFKDQMMAVNLSLWQNIEVLNQFVYHTVHSYFFKNKKRWFDPQGISMAVMWWLPIGQLPTLHMAKDKLEFLEKHGPTPMAFNHKQTFNAQGSKT